MKLVANCKEDVQLIKMVNFKVVVLFIRILMFYFAQNIWELQIHY